MSSMNKVILLGRVGRDPDVRFTQSGESVVSMTLATSESWKNKATGEREEKTEWHRLVIFGKTAETASQYVKKGRQILVEGSLQTRKWTKNNTDQYTTEIKVDKLTLLSGLDRNGAESEQPAGPTKPAPRSQIATASEDIDEEIPF